jgi:hypothetical protein
VSQDAEASDFRAGDEVRYIPGHAHGDVTHKDCEDGIVSSTNAKNVFVRYYRNGVLQETPQSTTPTDLLIVKMA